MKLGKVEPNIFDRSIYKQFHTVRPEVVSGKPRFGSDYATVETDGRQVVLASASVSFATELMVYAAVNFALTNLVVSGDEPVGIILDITLSQRMREIKLRAIMEQAQAVCEQYNLQIMGGHTEVSDAVIRPIVSCTAVGLEDKKLSSVNMRADLDIVMTGHIGMMGTSVIAANNSKELVNRLPEYLIDTAISFSDSVSVIPAAKIAASLDTTIAMHDVASGGVFAAVWELCEASSCGANIDLKAIPVRQETIEITEYFGINPYELMGQGALLIATTDGTGLVNRLNEAGVASAIIGKSTSSNDRIVTNGDEIRFIERPVSDAYYSTLH